MKKQLGHPIVLSLMAGLLLMAAWPMSAFTALIFVAFVPLYWLSTLPISRLKFTALIYLSMCIWNAGTTWWIWNSTAEGAIGAILANSLLMTLPWLAYFQIRNHFSPFMGYLALVLFWMSFEYIHQQDWGLSWPWLTLGNVFAVKPDWIQWYEFTGTSGGSLWVLLSNLLAFRIISSDIRSRKRTATAGFIVLLFVPILLSWFIKPEVVEDDKADNVVVVQPNIDPYSEKFAAGTQMRQIDKLLRLSALQTDSNTRLLVWPETAIPVQVWEDEILQNEYYQPIWAFLEKHPQLSILTGIDSYRKVSGDEVNDFSTRNPEGTNFYYKAYNTAALLGPGKKLQLYHKSKLVPGVETLPSWLSWLGRIFEKFGGISGTLATDKERLVLHSGTGFEIAPAICYESIYGEFLTGYIRKGANVIGIITNDGWWGNTPGHRQHMQYARLRAIESRRWVMRSANTGISCFIDPAGNVYNAQPWWTEAAIKMPIPTATKLTFFVRFGDLISKACLVLSLGFILWWMRKRFLAQNIRKA